MAEAYTVVVRHNLVVEIRPGPAPEGEAVTRTPLEASQALAANNLRNGCIDGDYRFDEASRARVFALLCLEFTQALAERRRASIERHTGELSWRADGEPLGHGAVPGGA